METNVLYYGDNLDILRKHIPENSIDLIYLDPPFNSKATYNVLFKEPTGESSQAQIAAFEDTWHWGEDSEQTFQEIVATAPSRVVDIMNALRKFIHQNDMMAYLTMMCIRLIELKRVLKPSGAIYLHCDPTASHYLKLLMDAIFGGVNFQNEIVWAYRTGGVSKRRFGRKHDILLFYSKTESFTFHAQRERIYYEQPFFVSAKDEQGRYYADVFLRDVWDIPAVINVSKERLGYPTQKPQQLLERIIETSSNKGGIVLDPFCGCGTALVAAQRLERKWIGIDLTYLAINIMKPRLELKFPGIKYRVIGEPVDIAGAKELASQNKYQFQWWALSLIGAQPYQEKKKGADTGIDGYVYFMDEKDKVKKAIVQVKSGGVSVGQIRDLVGVVKREEAEMSIFVTLKPPTKPMKIEAISQGFYKSPIDQDYPKMQIITIGELLKGQKPNIPPWVSPIQAPPVSRKIEGKAVKML